MRSCYPFFIAPFILAGIVTMCLALVLPIYTNSTDEQVTLVYTDSSGAEASMTVLALERTMTMWKLITKYDEISPATGTNLKLEQPISDYFSCSSGNTFTQGMKGFALVAVVVNACNLAVCIVHACLKDARILKCPLFIFLLVALGCTVPVTGATLLNFLSGWCGNQPLKDQGYKFGVSFYFIMASTGTTLIAVLMSICA